MIEGIGGTFGVPYSIGGGRTETLRSGCFTESLRRSDTAPVYWSHDWRDRGAAPIGHAQLREEADGVHATIQLYVDTDPKARSIFNAVEAGALRELSLGFLTPNSSDVVRRHMNEEVVRADLLELSIVMRGAGTTEIASTREAPSPGAVRTRSATSPAERPTMPPVSTSHPVLERAVNDRIRAYETAGTQTPDGLTPGARYVNSLTMSDRRSGTGFVTAEATTVTVRNSADLAQSIRLRDITSSNLGAMPAVAHHEIMEPHSGGRVLPLVSVYTDVDGVVEVAIESARTEGGSATAPYGTAPNQSSISFTERTAEAHRIATFVTTTRGVYRDKGAFQRVVNRLADDEWTRAADVELLNGNGEGGRLSGILDNSDVTEQAYDSNVESRFSALLRAGVTVRSHEYSGDLAAVIHPTDTLALFTETDDAGASTLRQEVLDLLRLRIVISSLIPAGTSLVGSFREGAHLYLRSGLEVAASTQHADDLARGRIRVLAEARADLEVVGGAFVTVTGL